MPRLFAALLAFLVTACHQPPPVIDLSGPTMGTTYSVKVVGAPEGVDSHAVRVAIDDVLATIDVQMSAYRPDSEISRFNASGTTDWFAVSGEFVAVVTGAQVVSERSGGALDITVAPLVTLWGMGPAGEMKELPDEPTLAAARARVGYRNLEVRQTPFAIRRRIPELTVDLNAVTPGYAVDLLSSKFEALGIANFMIDIGGEVRARGRNAQGAAWRIAIERPVDAEPEPFAIAQIDDMAITTSGEYRHYVMRDGHRYSHTIDPRTGRPVEHALASVAVVQPTALEADAWATALNVLGENEGYELAEKLRIPALFIVAKGDGLEHRMTTPFAKYLAEPLR
ncbi:thiamine biosynthesis lipoprotein [Povalibacter uvarum]|uniref:FAD:protein FMN transferase n=1 Tax=Povalibacter uvarum TaxID=732238 RepID=A0A841HUT0_9GAMM|nr:FAD:protein FMN transferase [Povalibacter uvarum]MBB6095732.1 thiamine biosynthesis lipoprotein [Povalibacter uvarum]